MADESVKLRLAWGVVGRRVSQKANKLATDTQISSTQGEEEDSEADSDEDINDLVYPEDHDSKDGSPSPSHAPSPIPPPPSPIPDTEERTWLDSQLSLPRPLREEDFHTPPKNDLDSDFDTQSAERSEIGSSENPEDGEEEGEEGEEGEEESEDVSLSRIFESVIGPKRIKSCKIQLVQSPDAKSSLCKVRKECSEGKRESKESAVGHATTAEAGSAEAGGVAPKAPPQKASATDAPAAAASSSWEGQGKAHDGDHKDGDDKDGDGNWEEEEWDENWEEAEEEDQDEQDAVLEIDSSDEETIIAPEVDRAQKLIITHVPA